MANTKSEQLQFFLDTDKPYGITFGAWTVKWWQWALSVSKDISPLSDQSGNHWNIEQPSSDVWFLVGIVGGTDNTFPHRSIKMEFGRSILIPILNCEANPLEYPDLKTDEDLVKHVVHDVNSVVKKDVFINGTRLSPVRVSSDPRIFKVEISKDNAFRIMISGSTHAAADGYWIFLKPLQRGTHTLEFEGSCEFGRLKAGASYEILIT